MKFSTWLEAKARLDSAGHELLGKQLPPQQFNTQEVPKTAISLPPGLDPSKGWQHNMDILLKDIQNKSAKGIVGNELLNIVNQYVGFLNSYWANERLEKTFRTELAKYLQRGNTFAKYQLPQGVSADKDWEHNKKVLINDIRTKASERVDDQTINNLMSQYINFLNTTYKLSQPSLAAVQQEFMKAIQQAKSFLQAKYGA